MPSTPRLAAAVLGAALVAAPRTAFPQAAAPIANPGRPTVTTPATLTPVGYLQFETGGLHAWRSPEFVSSFGLDETVRLAVWPRLQALLVSVPVEYARAPAASGVALADTFAGIQAVLRAGRGLAPTVALSYLRRIYSGPAPNLDFGSPTDSFLLLASGDWGKLHFDTNAIFNRMADQGVLRPQYGQTLSVSHPLRGRWSASGEIWHFTQPFLHANATGTLWAVGFAQRKNLVWDGGIDRGLTGTSTHWEAFAGFTYLLPRRLWR